MICLTVKSSAFENGGWIPDQFSGFGADDSPEITILGITKDVKSIAITLDDLGHPIHPGYNHWVIWNLPPDNVIPEGLPKGPSIDKPIHANQGIAYGKHCYRGPKPPLNWKHEYLFTVYALDATLSIDENASKPAVLKAMDGHILGKGELRGWYQRKHK